jgi:hypothetical protein
MKIITAPWKQFIEPEISIRALMGGSDQENFYDRIRTRYLERKDGKDLRSAGTRPIIIQEDELADKTGRVMDFGIELDTMLRPLRSDPKFLKKIELWMPEQRSDVGLILDPIAALNQLMRNAISAYDPLFSSNISDLIEAADPRSKANFAHAAEGVQRGITYRIARLQTAAQVFLNSDLLKSLPSSVGLKMHALGEAMQSLSGIMLEPEGPFAALYRLCDIAVKDPSKGKSLIYAAVTPPPPNDLPPPPSNGGNGGPGPNEAVPLPDVA